MQAKAQILALALTVTFPFGLYASPIVSGFNDANTSNPDIEFDVNFFGGTFTEIDVNRRGNITFNGAFDSFANDLDFHGKYVIAPFFEGITDSVSGNAITFGTGSFMNNQAFGVTWTDVGGFAQGENTFQLILANRFDPSDPSSSEGDFDVIFNYEKIEWDQTVFGDGARVGFSAPNGTEGDETFFQLDGSASPGTFLDGSNGFPLVENSSSFGDITTDYFRSADGGEDGRYIYQFRTTFDSPKPVPAPSTLALLGLGLIGFAALRRRPLSASLNHA